MSRRMTRLGQCIVNTLSVTRFLPGFFHRHQVSFTFPAYNVPVYPGALCPFNVSLWVRPKVPVPSAHKTPQATPLFIPRRFCPSIVASRGSGSSRQAAWSCPRWCDSTRSPAGVVLGLEGHRRFRRCPLYRVKAHLDLAVGLYPMSKMGNGAVPRVFRNRGSSIQTQAEVHGRSRLGVVFGTRRIRSGKFGMSGRRGSERTHFQQHPDRE